VKPRKEHGKGVLKDQALVARVVEMIGCGESNASVALKLGRSKNTITTIVRDAENTGLLRPIRARVLEAGAQAILDDIEKGNKFRDSINPANLTPKETAHALLALAKFRQATWIAVGILCDKIQNAPPSQVNVGLKSVDVVADYMARLRALTDPN
jgi:hypothetical protein